MIIAVQKLDTDTVAKLLDKGADPNAMDQNGETALIIAAKSDKKGVVAKLLEKGADKSAKCKNGETALMIPSVNFLIRSLGF